MAKRQDGRPRLRLNHSELVPPDANDAFIGMAWDAYLAAAVRLQPQVLSSLITAEAISALQTWHFIRDGLRSSAVGLLILEWCRRWGFSETYGFYPAWNTLAEAKRLQGCGRPVPDALVCTWDGAYLPKWLETDPQDEFAGTGATVVPEPGETWNPDGKQHPFPELAGRLLSHYTYRFVGGNGVQPMAPDQASKIGTQVVLELPTLYWDPTAETRAEARNRILETVAAVLDSDLDTIVHVYRAHGYQSSPEKRTDAHFEWLVRYHILGESYSKIAKSIEVMKPDGKRGTIAVKNVRSAVIELASLMGLELRPPSKGGRPRQKRRAARTKRLR